MQHFHKKTDITAQHCGDVVPLCSDVDQHYCTALPLFGNVVQQNREIFKNQKKTFGFMVMLCSFMIKLFSGAEKLFSFITKLFSFAAQLNGFVSQPNGLIEIYQY